MPKEDRVRLTIDLTDTLNARLEQIASDLGTTKTEVIKRSLALMDLANDVRKDGSHLTISKDGKSVQKEILLV